MDMKKTKDHYIMAVGILPTREAKNHTTRLTKDHRRPHTFMKETRSQNTSWSREMKGRGMNNKQWRPNKERTKDNNANNTTSQLSATTTKNQDLSRNKAVILKRRTVSFVRNTSERETQYGPVLAATFLCIWNVSRHGFWMSTETRIRTRSCTHGAALSASFRIMKLCLSTTAIVANLRIQNMKETLSHILADRSVEGKEDLIVPILVLSFVIKGSASLANMKAPLWLVSVGKARELSSAVNNDKFSSAAKNAKEFSIVVSTNVNAIVTTESVSLVRRNI